MALAKHSGFGVRMPKGPAKPSVLTADFPACVWRCRFSEGSGTALADMMGTVSDLTTTQNGAGNAWVNPGCWTGSVTASNEVFARTAGDAPATLRNLGSKSLIILFSGRISAGTTTPQVIGVGAPTSVPNHGYTMLHDGVNRRFSLSLMGSAGVNHTASFFELSTPTTDLTAMLVWDRSASSIGLASLYVNGTLVSTKAPSGDPGSITVATANKLQIDYNGLTQIAPARFYDASIWMPATIPANIADIAKRWSNLPDEFPQGLAGIARAT